MWKFARFDFYSETLFLKVLGYDIRLNVHKRLTVIGYADSIAMWCIPCAIKRFPKADKDTDHKGNYHEREDSKKNTVTAMFHGAKWAKWGTRKQHCDDCQKVMNGIRAWHTQSKLTKYLKARLQY